MNNVFKIKSPRYSLNPNIPSNIKKSLSNFRVTGKEFDAIQQICDDLGVEYESPGFVGNATAHFVFPKHKFAIFFHRADQRTRVSQRLKEFSAEGWHLIPLIPTTVLSQTQEQLKEQFKELLLSFKPNKRNGKN